MKLYQRGDLMRIPTSFHFFYQSTKIRQTHIPNVKYKWSTNEIQNHKNNNTSINNKKSHTVVVYKIATTFCISILRGSISNLSDQRRSLGKNLFLGLDSTSPTLFLFFHITSKYSISWWCDFYIDRYRNHFSDYGKTLIVM